MTMPRLPRVNLPLVGVLTEAWQILWVRVADPYRPERHYMRGPGPKARAKRSA
jgi:hypothetical protein